MPKLSPEMEKARTEKYISDLAECDFSPAKLARKRGTTVQNETQRVRKKPIQDALQRLLNSKKVKKKVALRLLEGFDSERIVGYLNAKVNGVEKVSDEIIKVEDMPTRLKYIATFLKACGIIDNSNHINVNASATVKMDTITVEGKPLKIEVGE